MTEPLNRRSLTSSAGGPGRAARPAAAVCPPDRNRDRHQAPAWDYLRAKAALWDARDREDPDAETEAWKVSLR